MKDVDKKQFLAVLNGMAAMKKSALALETISLWWACMADWDLADFQTAAVHLLKTLTFMPTPKDFEDLRKSGRETPGEAWADAVNHAASSAYRRGPLGAPLTDRVVQMLGGYKAIAMCDEDKLHFMERRFVEHYETLEDATATRDVLPHIALPRLAASMKRLTTDPDHLDA